MVRLTTNRYSVSSAHCRFSAASARAHWTIYSTLWLHLRGWWLIDVTPPCGWLLTNGSKLQSLPVSVALQQSTTTVQYSTARIQQLTSVKQVLAPRLLANKLHPTSSSVASVWNAIFLVFFAQIANEEPAPYNGCDCELPNYCVVPKQTGSCRDTLNNQ
jgi:hypothetical protein